MRGLSGRCFVTRMRWRKRSAAENDMAILAEMVQSEFKSIDRILWETKMSGKLTFCVDFYDFCAYTGV